METVVFGGVKRKVYAVKDIAEGGSTIRVSLFLRKKCYNER